MFFLKKEYFKLLAKRQKRQWGHDRWRKVVACSGCNHRKGAVAECRALGCGTTSDTVLAERRWRRPSTSAARRRLPTRYDCAVPWRQRNARTHSRNRILSGTRNQWSSQSNGPMCSDFLAEKISPAAACSIVYSLSKRCVETPARTELQ